MQFIAAGPDGDPINHQLNVHLLGDEDNQGLKQRKEQVRSFLQKNDQQLKSICYVLAQDEGIMKIIKGCKGIDCYEGNNFLPTDTDEAGDWIKVLGESELEAIDKILTEKGVIKLEN